MGASDSSTTKLPTEDVRVGRARRGRRRLLLLGIVGGFVLALVVVGLFASDPSTTGPSASPRSARAAPSFRLPSLRDPSAAVSLDDFRGRPVVVNFWASWCVPCRKEMPAFQAVYRQTKNRVAFVGINHEDARDDALEFVHQTGVQYPIGFDPDGTTARAYGLFGVPTTVFIDARGREVERHTGQLSKADLMETLNRLFPAK